MNEIKQNREKLLQEKIIEEENSKMNNHDIHKFNINAGKSIYASESEEDKIFMTDKIYLDYKMMSSDPDLKVNAQQNLSLNIIKKENKNLEPEDMIPETGMMMNKNEIQKEIEGILFYLT